tara:strand:+ start:924 stop:1598 length:675 start_codon:yes stop_codon:yes gene_type:complete
MLNIVFGSLKTTVAGNSAPSEFGFASMKLEANRGPKTSRRILFNREAAALLRLPKGAVQNLLFGFAQPDANNATPRLFVINTDEFLHETKETTYNTSKNESSFTDSREKGKAISSTKLSNEVRSFLGMQDDTTDINFEISLYSGEGEADIYELTVHVGAEEMTTDEILDTEVVGEEYVVDTIEDLNLDSSEYNGVVVNSGNSEYNEVVADDGQIPVSSGFNVPM